MKNKQQIDINELRSAVDSLSVIISRRLPEPKLPVPIGEKVKDFAAWALLFGGKLLIILAITLAVFVWTPWSWHHVLTTPDKNQNPFAMFGVILSGFAAVGLIIYAAVSIVEWAKDRIE